MEYHVVTYILIFPKAVCGRLSNIIFVLNHSEKLLVEEIWKVLGLMEHVFWTSEVCDDIYRRRCLATEENKFFFSRYVVHLCPFAFAFRSLLNEVAGICKPNDLATTNLTMKATTKTNKTPFVGWFLLGKQTRACFFCFRIALGGGMRGVWAGRSTKC